MAPQQSESRGLDKVIVRLPDGMRERIKAAADRNGRSMNAEIVTVLEQAFPPHPDWEQLAETVDSLLRVMTMRGVKPIHDHPHQVEGMIASLQEIKDYLEMDTAERDLPEAERLKVRDKRLHDNPPQTLQPRFTITAKRARKNEEK